MKQIYLTLLACLLTMGTHAQVSDILQEIEQNNTLLASLRQQLEAEKTGNRVGLNPENPEVEYRHLWGRPAEVGNGTEVEVTQQFDFPTAYIQKRKLAGLLDSRAELQYKVERKDILWEAQRLCIQLIYQNALAEVTADEFMLTVKLGEAYEKRFTNGEISILDFNKVKYDFLEAQKAYQEVVIEQEFLQKELIRLNGGKAISLRETAFPVCIVPDDFNAWYEANQARNHSLSVRTMEVNTSKTAEKLQRSMNLPKLSAGYVYETVLNEKSHGVILGVSIPLWGNKNTVKQLKAQTQANIRLEEDASLQYYHQAEALYKRVSNQQQLLKRFALDEQTNETPALLEKALNAGEISLIEYILELGTYFNIRKQHLEIERDLHLSIGELMQWEL